MPVGVQATVDNIDDAYLDNAIKELVGLLGITEPLNQDEYITLAKQKNYNKCVVKIAQHYRLSFRFNIKMVPRGYKASARHYNTSGLVKTDNQGKGTSGITAQIHLPASIPLYGDPKIEDITVSVVVGEECFEAPYTFVTIMAHEIAHLLLATLRHPKKDNEFYTDLVPLVLGFSQMVKYGRSTTKRVKTNDGDKLVTTSYCYLNDHQFNHSLNRLNGILLRFRDRKFKLIKLTDETDTKIKQLEAEIKERNKLLKDILKHSKNRISFDDSKTIVQLHSNSIILEEELMIKHAYMVNNNVRKAYGNVSHYSKNVVKQMNEAESRLKKTNSLLSSALSKLAADINIINRNLNLLYKISRYLHGGA
jgi:hypothetical protein